MKSTANVTNQTLHSAQEYPSSSQTIYNLNHGGALPSSIHTFQSNQQQYPLTPGMYQSQIPFQMPFPWPTMVNGPVGPLVNNNNVHVESRRGSKYRARSVDTGHRAHPPVHYYNHQQQLPPAPVVTEHYHHHHRYHHYQPQPTNVQVINTAASVETGKEQNVPLV
jgi:hypothetical protein